jgi:hypothetical protein
MDMAQISAVGQVTHRSAQNAGHRNEAQAVALAQHHRQPRHRGPAQLVDDAGAAPGQARALSRTTHQETGDVDQEHQRQAEGIAH